MSQPPDHQKEDQKHAIDPIETTNMALFPVPATTFEILKRGFNAPAQVILGDTLATSRQVGNDKECLLFILVPIGAQIGLDLIFLPQTNVSIESLARLVDQIRDRAGWQETTSLGPMLTSMLGADAKEIVPAIVLTERDHRIATKGTISDNGTFCFSNMRSQTLEQFFNTVP